MTKIYFFFILSTFFSNIYANELSLDQAQYRYNFAKKNYEKELNKIHVKNKKLKEINVKIDLIKKKLSNLQNQKQQAITEIEQSNEEIKSLKKLYERAEIDLRNILKSD
jgi:peptidoglycan hydrolase CwlO-like protein